MHIQQLKIFRVIWYNHATLKFQAALIQRSKRMQSKQNNKDYIVGMYMRLLDDAKQGVINTILVKDMSRFGRNYIMVGQYLDYVFPTFGIRFVALSDNIDTENKDTPAMDMMPITNVFNEWWAATTSKKLRAVRIKNAKEGKNGMSHPPYGYTIGTDEKRTLQVNEETAPIVKRIFKMRASGLTPRKIADVLNVEKVLTPNDYRISTTGINGVRSL